jgi:hypothetical protein
MIKKLIIYIKFWWKRHIVDECPEGLEEHEYSDKYR